MAKPQFSFDSSYRNFVAKLSMRFTEELSVVNQYCRHYEKLSDIYQISSDRQKEEVNLTALTDVQVGATAEVKRVAKILNKDFKLKLNFL
jgi:hypothetical protein